jgi:peptide deformylase
VGKIHGAHYAETCLSMPRCPAGEVPRVLLWLRFRVLDANLEKRGHLTTTGFEVRCIEKSSLRSSTKLFVWRALMGVEKRENYVRMETRQRRLWGQLGQPLTLLVGF